MTTLQQARTEYCPLLPRILQNPMQLDLVAGETPHLEESIASLFPHTHSLSYLEYRLSSAKEALVHNSGQIGVLFSGGQAPGGHNVIAGLYDMLKRVNPESLLIGFRQGADGLIKNSYLEITEELLRCYRNQGGFDLIGSARTKIETAEQFQAAEKTIKALNLNGLVIIGGDDSNTNAAFLAEYLVNKLHCAIIGVPKTIDGDMKGGKIELSFGFDTACKIYSEMIGNIMRDSLSAKKSYYFIRLMGRSASHIVLECALQTHPNLALIGEEVAAKGQTLKELVADICDLISERALEGKEYGVLLIPEGLIEFIPEIKQLIGELNALLACDFSPDKDKSIDIIAQSLSSASRSCLKTLPREIQGQLLLDRDPHGNVQVSKIETERLLMEMTKEELALRRKASRYGGKFSAQPLFYGYEGRSGLPSNFDCHYCYALGATAALLVDARMNGYMVALQQLDLPCEEWTVGAVPLVSMMAMEQRQGKPKAVIKKALVDLEGTIFKTFAQARSAWRLSDNYCFPGPIQFFGPTMITDVITDTLRLQNRK